MSIRKHVPIAFVLSTLLFSPSVLAQAEQMKRDELHTSDACPPDLDITPPIDERGMEMCFRAGVLEVRGGRPGDAVAILVGLRRHAYTLPGGAQLLLQPIAILASGTFGDDGSWQDAFDDRVCPTDGLTVYVQAITVIADSTDLATSGLMSITFDCEAIRAQDVERCQRRS